VLVLFHDVTDPASAVAVARATRLAADGVPIAFEGFEAVGVDVHLPPDVVLLARLADLAGEAAAEGVVLRRPARVPPTGLAHVLLDAAEGTPAAAAVRTALYRAFWEGGEDLADPAVLHRVGVAAGMDGDEVAGLLADRLALAARRRRTTGFRREGVGGVPVLLANRTLVPGLLDEEALRALAATA
jgi:predicted DsbA family dithiol-disulfide isomerase